MIKSSLRNIDAEILEAGDGTEAVQFFDGQHIDLLITDYNMPQMDGATLVSKVREMQAYQFMPAIMLTTERSQEKKENLSNKKRNNFNILVQRIIDIHESKSEGKNADKDNSGKEVSIH